MFATEKRINGVFLFSLKNSLDNVTTEKMDCVIIHVIVSNLKTNSMYT